MAEIDISKMKAEDFKKDLKPMVTQLEAVRSGNNNMKPVEISFEEFVKGKYGISQDAFYEKLGMKRTNDVMQYNHIEWTKFTVR